MHRNLFARIIRVPSHVSRSFSVTPPLWTKSTEPIDLTHFWNPDGDGLRSSSDWQLKWMEPFCDLQYKSGLRFTNDNLRNVDLFPEERVFAECTATRDDIVKGTWVLDLEDVDELDVKDPKLRFIIQEHRRLKKEKVNVAFEQMQRVLRQHAVAEERALEKNINSFALVLAQLCGFGSGKFEFGGLSIAFKFAGKKLNSEADVYVAMRKGAVEQLVLIWEDKLSKSNAGKNLATANMLEASAAQIIGEMISVQFQNADKKFKPCEVYAVRLIDDMVAFFRMEMTAEQIEAVCEDGVIPNPKLQVCLLLRIFCINNHSTPRVEICHRVD